MAKTPIISVIVPVYKVELYLDRCVESILAQTYTALDIILVDDGSPDNSGAMCDEWARKDDRVRVIHKENGGLSDARNFGLNVATGEYIVFIDSDDVIHPDMFRVLLQAMQETDAQIATCEVTHTFEGDAPAYTCDGDLTVLTPSEAIERLWYQTGFYPSACTKMYNRNVFSSHRFEKGLLFEDVEIMHKLLWSAERIVHTPAKLYGYMHRRDSITTARFTARDLDILEIADRMLAFAEETAPLLCGAAQAYAVTAAMRVELNAPKTAEFIDGRAKAQKWLKEFGFAVLRDKKTRRKTRYALLLYFACRPLLRAVYKRVDRWK